MGLVSDAKSGSKTGIIGIAELFLALIHKWDTLEFVKWGASSRCSSSLYFAKRNSDQMTIGKTRPTLLIYHVDPFTELSIVPAGIFEAGYISTRLQW